MHNIEASQNREDYTNPIDLTDIFYKNNEDPLYEWGQGGRTTSDGWGMWTAELHIANQIGVGVDEFIEEIQQQSQLGDGGNDDDVDWSTKSNLKRGSPKRSGGRGAGC